MLVRLECTTCICTSKSSHIICESTCPRWPFGSAETARRRALERHLQSYRRRDDCSARQGRSEYGRGISAAVTVAAAQNGNSRRIWFHAAMRASLTVMDLGRRPRLQAVEQTVDLNGLAILPANGRWTPGSLCIPSKI